MMSHLFRPALATALLVMPSVLLADSASDQAGGATVTVVIKGLRNAKGLIRACLTQKAATFPECEKDAGSLRLSVPARNGPALVFRHVPAGTYAVSLFHDANANNRLDTFMGIPSEGFGFSRDAPVKMAPPKFAAAQFAVGTADVTTPITVRYIL
jgi:uncharacterized protein (DUF2141 family)